MSRSSRSRWACSLVVLGFGFLGICGCGGEAAKREAKATRKPSSETKAGPQKASKPGQPEAPSTGPAPRKIIQTAHLDVIVENLDAAMEKIDEMLTQYEAYVAKSEARNDTGARRIATYTIRVPVSRFREMKKGMLALGVSERNAVESQDVTEEFVDVQARIKTLEAEEEVLNRLLKESRTRDEVLKTREQIRAIRGDIECSQARLEHLSRLTTLSTIHLTMREVKDYKPPTAPDFDRTLSQTFHDSWGSFVDLMQGVCLFLVALAPWLILLVPIGLGSLWMVRRLMRFALAERRARLAAAASAQAHASSSTEPSEPPRPGA